MAEAVAAGQSEVAVWGSGTPRRELMFVDDLADALVFIMQHYEGEAPINVGTGEDVAIAEIARLIAEVVGFGGTLRFDVSQPDGTPRKLLDSSELRALGWRHRTTLDEGMRLTFDWYRHSLHGQ
jgi:GDP-L-fucose synthase